MAFLGFPDPFPDSRTIWLFRERMARTGRDKVVWAELQRQLDAMGLQVKRGTVQDATFIEADPGSSNKSRGGVSRTVVRGSFDIVETMPRLAAARMELGPRKAMKLISGTSCIKTPTSTTV